MSNPTDLPDLAEAVRKLVKAKGRFHTEQNYKELADALARYDARRAQPEGEAPQADLKQIASLLYNALNDVYQASMFDGEELKRVVRAMSAYNRYRSSPAATLSPLCGAQHAESGYAVVPIEPTERMIYEGGIGRRDQMVDAADVWRQMLRAAQLDGGQEGSGSNG